MSELLPIRTILNRISLAALDGLVIEKTINGNSGHRQFTTEIVLGDGTPLTLMVSFSGTIPSMGLANVQVLNDHFVYSKPMDMGSYFIPEDAEHPNIAVRLSKPTAAREIHKLLKESRYPATLRITEGYNAEDVEATFVRFVLENSHEFA